MTVFARECRVAGDVARLAGLLLETRRHTDDLVVGGGVATGAGREADALMRAGLAAAFPDDAILSEESADPEEWTGRRRVWVLDPLDGLRRISGETPEYSVSIGLAVAGVAVIGAVVFPAQDTLVVGARDAGVTVDGRPVRVSTAEDPGSARIATSSRDARPGAVLAIADHPIVRVGIARRLARVAAGLDDAVVAAVPRTERGACAGAALVVAAGGTVTGLDGGPIRFDLPEPRRPSGIVAANPRLHGRLLRLLREDGRPVPAPRTPPW